MTLVNQELQNKISKLTNKTCGTSCKKCKASSVENLQNRARLYKITNKRRLPPSNECPHFHDALEYDIYHPLTKYRKFDQDQHRTSESAEDPGPSTTMDLATARRLTPRPRPFCVTKRKGSVYITPEEVDAVLELFKKRIKEYKYSPYQDNLRVDPEKEKQIEERYKKFLKSLDLSTINHILRSDKSRKRASQSSDIDVNQTNEAQHTLRERNFHEHVEHSIPVPKITFSEAGSVGFEPPDDTQSTSISGGSQSVPHVPVTSEEKKDEKLDSTKTTEDVTKAAEPVQQTSQIQNLFGPPKSDPKPNLFDSSSQNKPKSLFSSEGKDKSPFDIFDKIKAPIPQGNPLFAPSQHGQPVFVPKTDGANFVFGQSQPAPKPVVEPQNMFQNTQPKMNPIFTPQISIPGFGQPMVQQSNAVNPFAGQFIKPRRGRGRGRGR